MVLIQLMASNCMICEMSFRQSFNLNVLSPVSTVNTIAVTSVYLEKFITPSCSWISSPILSFLIAFSFSSIRPQTLPLWLEKVAWTNILQAALALGLWGNSNRNSISNSNSQLKHMILAFLFGCIGTLSGSLIGFFTTSKLINPSLLSSFKACSACLSATYIGGTANFFEVANILNTLGSSVITAVAAADIAIMCFYFALLSVLQSNPQLQNMFSPYNKSNNKNNSNNNNNNNDNNIINCDNTQRQPNLLAINNLSPKLSLLSLLVNSSPPSCAITTNITTESTNFLLPCNSNSVSVSNKNIMTETLSVLSAATAATTSTITNSTVTTWLQSFPIIILSLLLTIISSKIQSRLPFLPGLSVAITTVLAVLFSPMRLLRGQGRSTANTAGGATLVNSLSRGP